MADVKKQEAIDKFDPNSQKVMDINNYLMLGEEMRIDHKELFLDQYKLEHHFRVSDYFFKSNEYIKNRLTQYGDFNIKTLRSSKSKVHFINEFIKVINPEHNDKTIRPIVKKCCNKKQNKSINEGYRLIFKNNDKRGKDLDLSTKLGCEKMINNLYSHMFDKTLMKESRVRIDKKQIGQKKLVVDSIKVHESIYVERQHKHGDKCLEIVDGDIVEVFDGSIEKSIKASSSPKYNQKTITCFFTYV